MQDLPNSKKHLQRQRRNGVKPFSSYMHDWLYGEDGYYTKFRTIGKEGDFYTAVSSSMFFGGAIARRLIEVIDEGFLPENTTVVEIGAHQGYLLADMVQFVYTLRPELLKTLKFAIVEPQAENRQAQKKYFHEAFGDVVVPELYADLSEVVKKDAFVVANEIFDAFSCELVKENQMLYAKEDHTFLFAQQDDFTAGIVQKYGLVKGEVARGYEDFAQAMAKAFARYEFVTFDYGDLEPRPDFSIRIYYKHQTIPFFALTDFVEDEAEKPENLSLEMLCCQSDITYDVHFNHLIDAYKASGAVLHQYKTQLATLVNFGIIELLDMLQKNADEKTYQSELNRAKMLIDPTFMGERFKGVIFRKGNT
jgi:SAM-dependent MidA family methyltransferase